MLSISRPRDLQQYPRYDLPAAAAAASAVVVFFYSFSYSLFFFFSSSLPLFHFLFYVKLMFLPTFFYRPFFSLFFLSHNKLVSLPTRLMEFNYLFLSDPLFLFSLFSFSVSFSLSIISSLFLIVIWCKTISYCLLLPL